MSKNLYSLMLNEDVVREVDLLAHRLGTNRSNLINQILADYVNYTTPERRINDVFSAIEELMTPSREIVPFFTRNSSSMSLKSSLEYKYRPTVKYEVSLFNSAASSSGEISVLFRTQSESLLRLMTVFFSLWKQLEEKYIPQLTGSTRIYSLADGRFTRSISIPDSARDSEAIAKAISDYISLFDRLMKDFIAGRISAGDVETEYRSCILKSDIII